MSEIFAKTCKALKTYGISLQLHMSEMILIRSQKTFFTDLRKYLSEYQQESVDIF